MHTFCTQVPHLQKIMQILAPLDLGIQGLLNGWWVGLIPSCISNSNIAKPFTKANSIVTSYSQIHALEEVNILWGVLIEKYTCISLRDLCKSLNIKYSYTPVVWICSVNNFIAIK